MEDKIIEIIDLKKNFGDFAAVKGISFAIPKGMCFGLLGPNGAGKTTTLEIIEGIQKATSGEIKYKNQPREKNFFEEVGLQLQHTELLSFLTVEEVLRTFQNLYKNQYPYERLVEVCHLGPLLKRQHKNLSGGQKQRLLLALSLANDPELIFLDEPTTGLDPQSRRNLWDIIRDIKKSQKTIVLTTHYLEEAYLLCDEIAIMDHGEIIVQGTPKELLKEHFNETIIEIPKSYINSHLDQFQSKWKCVERDEKVEIYSQNVNDHIKELIEKNINLQEMNIRHQTLDDLFFKLTGHGLRT